MLALPRSPRPHFPCETCYWLSVELSVLYAASRSAYPSGSDLDLHHRRHFFAELVGEDFAAEDRGDQWGVGLTGSDPGDDV